MHFFFKLTNTIKKYEWGSAQGIASILGTKKNTDEPWAEFWMGAHPCAPSSCVFETKQVSLFDLLLQHPSQLLGKSVAKEYNNTLPFLFKILSAEKPLSIQVHPNREQAKTGFAQENMQGLDKDSPQRNYKDDQHKPEILIALTPFIAMCGFRKEDEIIALFEKLGAPLFINLIAEVKKNKKTENFPGEFYKKILSIPQEIIEQELPSLIQKVESLFSSESPTKNPFTLVSKFSKLYPKDSSILAPLYLNVITLSPLQGIFLPAGILHAYVIGTGIELMANSDNVLRAGLTPKHIDITELLRITKMNAFYPHIIEPAHTTKDLFSYKTEAKEFELDKVSCSGKKIPITTNEAPSILLVTEGEFTLTIDEQKETLNLKQGESAFIGALAKAYTLSGTGEAFLAKGYNGL